MGPNLFKRGPHLMRGKIAWPTFFSDFILNPPQVQVLVDLNRF